MKISQKINLFFIVILGLFLISSIPVLAQEKITNFQSNITVNSDGSLIVTENITVQAQGQEIKRGIYRDFPTKYKDRLGNNYNIDFKIIEVLRDEKNINYWTENLSNGIRTYMGAKNIYIDPGEYTYTFIYETARQLGFFENHDELYWNVTGQGWIFPIDKASATVSLPKGINANDIKLDAYTGSTGSTAKNFTSQIKNNKPYFETTKPLNSYEGLTIVVGWPKGFIVESTTKDKILYLLKDNISLLLALLALIIIVIYYLVSWSRVGKDPKKGTLIPYYEPPHDMSAAGTRYLKKMRFDDKVFVAKIIDMAIKGYIKIEEKKSFLSTKRSINKIKNDLTDIDNESRGVLSALFPQLSDTTIELKNKNYKKFQEAKKSLSNSLTFKINGKLFKKNLKQFMIGTFLSFGLVILTIIISGGKNSASPLIIPIIVIIFVVNLLFSFLLKAPTKEGRKVLDEIEGFKWFLSVTEKDRMNFHNPPDKTPELFERYLPYALALGVENKWAEQFSNIFSRLADQGRPYSPIWYTGTNFDSKNISNFTDSLSSSFSRSVSSSSRPPGSSSGFGGGGAGGGGGGGGGGGF